LLILPENKQCLEKNPEKQGSPDKDILQKEIINTSPGKFTQAPWRLRKSCSWVLRIRSPAPTNNNALKHACTIKWENPPLLSPTLKKITIKPNLDNVE